jgi:peptidoglycan/LPS O-acetylase OafA/YrhL
MAVDGFLLMSGWLNSMSMDSTYYKGPTTLLAVKHFFIHRSFRIAPVYYLLMLCLLVLLGPDHRAHCWDSFWYNIFFASNYYLGTSCWMFAWSLVLEV